jgi:hypothetical protein
VERLLSPDLDPDRLLQRAFPAFRPEPRRITQPVRLSLR